MPYADPREAKRAKRRYYLANKQHVIDKAAQWRRDNPKRYNAWKEKYRLIHNAQSRRWYANNKQRVVNNVRKWRKRHPDKKAAQGLRYRLKHKEKIKLGSLAYRQKNRERDRVNSAKRRRALKLEIIAVYGGKCACCGEKEEKFLTVDHVKNNGKEHRKEGKGGYTMHVWLKRNGFPKRDYRILCWNCNLGRYYNGGRCPHKC